MWYRYKDYSINVENILFIEKDPADGNYPTILFQLINHSLLFEFKNSEERDAEFEKICKMLGLEEKEHISRCC